MLDGVFYQKLSREAILPAADVKNIFTNLEEIVQLHGNQACIVTHWTERTLTDCGLVYWRHRLITHSQTVQWHTAIDSH